MTMTTSVTLGLVQMRCGQDPQTNTERAIAGIVDCAKQGAQIICTQELFRSLYFCDVEAVANFDLAEPIPGPTTEQLSKIAHEYQVVIVASLFEKRAPGLYHNTAVVFDADGKMLGKYRKMHIPDDPGYYEKFYFTPGDLGFKSYETRYGKIGGLVCWDQWYPEAARLTALSGAQILFYPTAIGWHISQDEATNLAQHQAWHTIQRSHSVANGVFVAAVNRVGDEGEMKFWGQSFVSDPFGRVLTQGTVSEEQHLIVECNLSEIENTRRHWPFLRDRRIDAYGDITQRFRD